MLRIAKVLETGRFVLVTDDVEEFGNLSPYTWQALVEAQQPFCLDGEDPRDAVGSYLDGNWIDVEEGAPFAADAVEVYAPLELTVYEDWRSVGRAQVRVFDVELCNPLTGATFEFEFTCGSALGEPDLFMVLEDAVRNLNDAAMDFDEFTDTFGYDYKRGREVYDRMRAHASRVSVVAGISRTVYVTRLEVFEVPADDVEFLGGGWAEVRPGRLGEPVYGIISAGVHQDLLDAGASPEEWATAC